MRRLATAAVTAVLAAGSAVQAAPPPADDAAIVHVLNRIGFGAAPGDIERVRAEGLHTYIERQLEPERLPAPDLDGPRTRGDRANPIAALAERKVLRAIYGERQL